MRPLEPFSKMLRLAWRLVGRFGSVVPGLRGSAGQDRPEEEEPEGVRAARDAAAERVDEARATRGAGREAGRNGSRRDAEGASTNGGPDSGGESASEPAAGREAASSAGPVPGRGVPYEEWTKAELYERAKELDIPGRSGMSKQELVDALRAT